MHRLGRLLRDDRGAVAPTVALSLIGLIAVGGIAFDYAHMATLDTELQSAADQAALAAASQLDGQDGACTRAVAAAQDLLANKTLLANDGGGIAVTIADSNVCTSATQITDDPDASVRFFKDKGATIAATTMAEANFVEVKVNTRRANYALTPIVGVFSSGDIGASARAGMGTALCKVPPLMICPPTGAAIDWATMKGVGVRAVSNTGSTWAPGDFGFIGPSDSPSVQKGLAFQNPVFQCQEINSEESVSPGSPTPAITAINTRFDIYNMSTGGTLGPCFGTACPPARNVTKDLVRDPLGGNCGIVNKHATQAKNDGWHLIETAANRFSPRTKNAADTAMTQLDANGVIDAMGLPRDNCHYTSYGSTCPGTNPRFGDGKWARGDYFNKYHAGRIPLNASTMTRYETYRWEIDNDFYPGGTGTGDRQEGKPVCNATIPDPSRDRRVVQVAVGSNCGDLRGTSRPVQISGWIDMFLVEPGVAPPGRGNGDGGNEIYLEVIGPVDPGGAAAQVIRRDTPYLVR